jgi:hypothetical protein
LMKAGLASSRCYNQVVSPIAQLLDHLHSVANHLWV